MPDLNSLTLDALFDHLSADGRIRRLLELARDEDLGPPPPAGPGDLTSLVAVAASNVAGCRIVARRPGIIAGLRALPLLLDVFGSSKRVGLQLHAADGFAASAGATLAVLQGPARDLLALERTALNLLARLSGVATHTASFVALVAGTRARILDTRKTTPGLRAPEKYAVRCGGGFSHRLGLFDAVLLKDNHLAHVPLAELGEHVAAAAARALAIAAEHGQGLAFVECEVDTLDQFRALLAAEGRGGAKAAGLDVILLDNMPLETLREAIRLRDASGIPVQLEASGGVNEGSVRAIAETGIDRISIGALTHHAVSLDLALDFF